MKQFLFFLLFIGTVSLSAQTDSVLTVKITGIENSKGHVLLGLYDNATDWTKPDVALFTQKAPATEGTMLIEFAHLAPGTYSIAALHDADDSGNMTFSAFGLPKEVYGFSNDARGVFSAPNYEACRFSFGRSGMISMALK